MKICLQCCSRQLLQLHLGAQDRHTPRQTDGSTLIFRVSLKRLIVKTDFIRKVTCALKYTLQNEYKYHVISISGIPFSCPFFPRYQQRFSHLVKFIASLVHTCCTQSKIKIQTDSRLALVGCFLSICSLKAAKTCAKCSFNQLLNCLFVQICHAHTHSQHYTQLHTKPAGKGGCSERFCVCGTLLFGQLGRQHSHKH